MRKLTWTIGMAAVAAAFQLAADEGRDPRAPYDQLEVDRALPQFTPFATDSAEAREFGTPYEQIDIDRALPQFPELKDTERKAVRERGAPYDQLEVDRTPPQLPDGAGDMNGTRANKAR